MFKPKVRSLRGPYNEAFVREEHLLCRPNMHDEGKLNVCGGNKL